MIQKLFNFAKKKSEYYLELNEDESLQDKLAEAKEVVEDKFNEAKKAVAERASAVTDDAKKQADSAKKEVEKTVNSAKEEEKKSKSETDKETEREVRSSDSNGAASQSSGASSWEQPFWVKAMFEKSSNNGKATEEESTFATDNLMPIPTNYRRRPGPSLDKYKAMANETKIPRS